MSMIDWAKNEVELACKREAPDRKEGEFDYGCGCYESALKAFISLAEEGHSGMSIQFTKNILNRLIDGKPLTPIEDTPDAWRYSFDKKDGTKVYQCLRMGSLFKKVHPDGKTTYDDIDRCYFRKLGSDLTYQYGFGSDILNGMFPIEMPYMPANGKYQIVTEEFLTDRKNGDFDTKIIWSIDAPGGVHIPVERYFAEKENGWEEIEFKEFLERKNRHIERVLKEERERKDACV